MNRLILILLFVMIFWASSCQRQAADDFGIYLLAEDKPATQLVVRNLDTIDLQEKPVIGMDDIVSYDRDSHRIRLSRATYQRVQELFTVPVRVDGIPFVVRVGDEPIYSGAFWTPLSSLSYDGVIILQPFDDQDEMIGLALGYPSPAAFTGEDPRSDPRITEALGKAGKLTAPIARTNSLPRSMKGYEMYSWYDEELDSLYYTLITGTNRLKTVEEITAEENQVTQSDWVKITVSGTEDLKALLERLPSGTYLAWRGSDWLESEGQATANVILPDSTVLDVIQDHCQQLEIELHLNE